MGIPARLNRTPALTGKVCRSLAAWLLAAVGWLPMAPQVSASTCPEAVQGVIAWDGRGNTQWAPSDVDTLCRGAEQSLEPTHCFRAVMSGRIEWGGGTLWKPRNALNLCRGSQDARATLRCFTDSIAAGDHWRTGIARCQASTAAGPGSAAQAAPVDDSRLPADHSFGIRDGEFTLGGDRVYRTSCSNCRALYCAPGDELVSHGGACEFGAIARQAIGRSFVGPCAGIGCWSVNLLCRGAQSKPLTVIESRSSIQARCLDAR